MVDLQIKSSLGLRYLVAKYTLVAALSWKLKEDSNESRLDRAYEKYNLMELKSWGAQIKLGLALLMQA